MDAQTEVQAAALTEVDASLNQFPELKVCVFDALAARRVITKANYRKLLAAVPKSEPKDS